MADLPGSPKDIPVRLPGGCRGYGRPKDLGASSVVFRRFHITLNLFLDQPDPVACGHLGRGPDVVGKLHPAVKDLYLMLIHVKQL